MRHNPAAESRLQRSAAQLPPTIAGLCEDTDTQSKEEETLPHKKKQRNLLNQNPQTVFLSFLLLSCGIISGIPSNLLPFASNFVSSTLMQQLPAVYPPVRSLSVHLAYS